MSKKKFDLAHIARFKASGLPLKAYCRSAGISVSTLQYHLAKERRRNEVTAARFVPISFAPTADVFSLQWGPAGLRIRLNLDFTL